MMPNDNNNDFRELTASLAITHGPSPATVRPVTPETLTGSAIGEARSYHVRAALSRVSIRA